jgi:hypothetical protein
MRHIHTVLFAAGIVAALGFGSASAFATPTTERVWSYCPFFADEGFCMNCCADQMTAIYDYNHQTGECRCWLGRP